jgi:DNA gyrase subunit A
MGRDTSGVRGMDLAGEDDAVLAMDVARDDQELLVLTENGYGKRTSVAEYRKTNRGTKGVGTIKLTERKGALAGALVVREHEELVFISESGMVQRTGVRGISRYGRLSQGVRLMNLKDEDRVSAVALVVESEDEVEVAVGADGAVGESAAAGDRELAPEEALDPEAALAADPDGEVPGEPEEVDLDDVDGPPTPGA